MTVFILDNSVTMRWFFEPGSHPHADAILKELTNPGSEAVVPLLWRYEVSAVLSRAQARNAIPPNEVVDFMQDLEALPIRLDVDHARIFTDVHRTAVSFGLTSYDAAYLELARRRALPLATLDKELMAACQLAGVPLL